MSITISPPAKSTSGTNPYNGCVSSALGSVQGWVVPLGLSRKQPPDRNPDPIATKIGGGYMGAASTIRAALVATAALLTPPQFIYALVGLRGEESEA